MTFLDSKLVKIKRKIGFRFQENLMNNFKEVTELQNNADKDLSIMYL